MNVIDRMRAEWNQRASGDANFYVAFRRHNQAEEDFLASAAEVMPMFNVEFRRLPAGPVPERRALEIGCGPGRLMVAMSPHFGEIHGVDISSEMVEMARKRLRGVHGASVHLTSGADLSMFAESHFDFVYSYVVFQHIPSREIVLNYLREAHRVLKSGGILCCQLRGTPAPASEISRESDTWTGCYFNGAEIALFAREQDFPLVALSGLGTQYMWATFRKARAGIIPYTPAGISVNAVTATGGAEPRIPARGREAAVSLWLEGMPESASLGDCQVLFADREQLGCYLSPVSESGGCQLDSRLPEGLMPGEYQAQLRVCGESLGKSHPITVLPAPALNPRVIEVTDGVNLSSRYRIEAGSAKVLIEDVPSPAAVSFDLAGHRMDYVHYQCRDPITSTYEFGFDFAQKAVRGRHRLLKVQVGGVELAPIELEIV